MRRKPTSKSIRRLLIARQRGLCACGCGEWLEITGFDVDHWTPLALGGDNDLPNLRALRIEHHREKTARDVRQIRKADRAGRKHRGEHQPKGRKLQGRGFAAWRGMDGTIRHKS